MAICLLSEVKMLSVCKKATAKRDHLSGPSPRFSVLIPRWRDTETLTWKLQIAKANSWRLLHHLWPLSWSHIQKEVKRLWSPLYISKCGAWPESWDVAIQGSATLDIKGIFKVLLCQRSLFSLGFISFTISCWAWKSSQWLKRLKLLTQPVTSCYFKVSSCSYICMCVCMHGMCMCAECMWRPEDNFRCPSLNTRPRTHHVA